MQGLKMDWAINIPEIIGGAIFLITIGKQLGIIASRLEYLGQWHDKASDKIADIDGRVSHIEGHLRIRTDES